MDPVKARLEKVAGLSNAYTVIIERSGRDGVCGRVAFPTRSDHEPFFMPAPGRMAIRAEELQAIAAAMLEGEPKA